MSRFAVIVLALGAGMLASVAQAQDGSRRIEVHGFGSWSFGKTSDNNYLGGLPQGNYRKTDFALNVSATVTDRLRIVGQSAWHEFEQEGEQEGETELDYIFAEWKFSDSLRLRAGQVKQPFGISTDVFAVGTLRPFLSLPQAVYGPVGMIGLHYKGIGLTGSFEPAESWTLTYDVYGGGMDLEEFLVPEDFVRGEPVSNEETIERETTKNLLGGRLQVDTPLPGLRFGVSGCVGDEVGADRRTVYGAHAEYLNEKWSLRAEYAHEASTDNVDVDGYYGEAAYRFTSHWQVAAQYGWLTTAVAEPEITDVPSLLEHEELALGLNYWFTPELVLKASYHRVDGNRLAAPEADALEDLVDSGELAETTDLFLFGAQFTF